jgi:hypothetical protein
MREHLADVGEDRLAVSSFFGGAARGRCIQLTAQVDGRGYAQLTKAEVVELIVVLVRWLGGGK